MPESSAHPQPKNSSRFSLRSLFALTFCLAVGLACGIASSGSYEEWRNSLGVLHWVIHVLQVLHGVLFASASAAICIGLLQQAIFLSRSHAINGHTFFAVGWRLVIAVVLILCLLVEMLVIRGYVTLPEEGGYGAMYYGLLSPELPQYACLLIVLGEYRYRLLPIGKSSPCGLGKFTIIWTAATLLILLLLPRHLMVHFLAYIVFGDIEAHQPLLYQRLGAYPDHHAEGFWFFWLSFTAVICLAVGAAIWFWLLCNGKKGLLTQRLAVGLAVVLLGCSSWYAVWYYTQGLAGISPEFGEAGFLGNWFDCLGIGGVLALLITAAAAWIAGKEGEAVSQQSFQSPAYHENPFVLLVLAAIAISLGVSFLEAFFLWPTSFSHIFIVVLAVIDIFIYIPLAISLLSIQVLWLRWKSRSDLPGLTLPVIDWQKFGVAWLSLALMLLIGVPVISAFCFSFWLGPWYLL